MEHTKEYWEMIFYNMKIIPPFILFPLFWIAVVLKLEFYRKYKMHIPKYSFFPTEEEMQKMLNNEPLEEIKPLKNNEFFLNKKDKYLNIFVWFAIMSIVFYYINRLVFPYIIDLAYS